MKRQTLVIVAYKKAQGASKVPAKNKGRYHLQAREDLAKLTAQNVKDVKLTVATRKKTPDWLLTKRFFSVSQARDVADANGFEALTHQQIAIRAAKWRKLQEYSGAKQS